MLMCFVNGLKWSVVKVVTILRVQSKSLKNSYNRKKLSKNHQVPKLIYIIIINTVVQEVIFIIKNKRLLF